MQNIDGKISKNIKIDRKRIAKISFKLNDSSDRQVQNYILSSIKKLNKFYKIAPPKINLELIYSRDDFNNKAGWQTPDWMVGLTLKNTIYLFSPLVVEKVSTHKKRGLNKIITHELCHLFNQKINKEVLVVFDEGLALFLANQKKKNPKKAERIFFIKNFLTKNINYQSFIKNNGYKLSYWLVSALARRLPKNKLIDFLKINREKENIKNEIEKILKMPINKFFLLR